jgi:sec-independent protein translocase protein TatA
LAANIFDMTHALLIWGMIGWPQVVLIAVVVLLLFGGKKIPELMRGLGGGVREFKDAMKEGEGDENKPARKD